MLVAHKNPVPIGSNRFIDAIAIEKTMVEDRDDRLLFFYEPVIEINQHYYVCRSALKKAWAFWSVSSYSFAGSESATIPAPTCKYPFPPHSTKVRMTILKSRLPFQPMYPNDPVYRPRRTGSSSSMISIQRTFGTPVMVPPGNSA